MLRYLQINTKQRNVKIFGGTQKYFDLSVLKNSDLDCERISVLKMLPRQQKSVIHRPFCLFSSFIIFITIYFLPISNLGILTPFLCQLLHMEQVSRHFCGKINISFSTWVFCVFLLLLNDSFFDVYKNLICLSIFNIFIIYILIFCMKINLKFYYFIFIFYADSMIYYTSSQSQDSQIDPSF